MPRFAPETYARNLALLPPYEAVAREAGCTPVQLALAWLLSRGEHVIPLPGTTRIEHLRENLAAWNVRLSASVLTQADALINQHTVTGGRYGAQSESEVDTERF
jgi:aryl-alcohol dehydrogenase-like predicted oxidoreductase